jgi:ubiquinone/menaquinone biosynthesis C-methylase UbiE
VPEERNQAATEQRERYWQNWDRGDAARRIDEFWRASEQPWRQALAEDVRAVLEPRVPVLEVGCGSGLIYNALRQHGIVTADSYSGGDISNNMVQIARQRYPTVHFSVLDILNLSLPDRSQRNVINVHVLQHLPHYEAAMRELLRITADTLYVVSWFTRKPEDEITFSEPSAQWDQQSFFNNYYSLPKFLGFVFSATDRPIRHLRVHQFGRPWSDSYSVVIRFADSAASERPGNRLRRLRSQLSDTLKKVRVNFVQRQHADDLTL